VIVVDTNVIIYRWIPGPRSPAAEALMRVDSVWAAPLLWRSEFRQLLSHAIRSARIGLADAERLVGHASSSLLGGEHAVPDHIVLDLAARSRCTAYDCEFAGLALALGTSLITEDKALLGSFPEFCRSLRDITEHGLR
jgi:predicted nucleic acid-binding protein